MELYLVGEDLFHVEVKQSPVALELSLDESFQTLAGFFKIVRRD
jgi:hypothetical protein